MSSDASPSALTTVLSADTTVIHLAPTQHPAPSPPTEHLTLCGGPVVGRVTAQSFHRHGCARCAREAVHAGVTSIADRQLATVNLPRFLAARGGPFPGASTG